MELGGTGSLLLMEQCLEILMLLGRHREVNGHPRQSLCAADFTLVLGQREHGTNVADDPKRLAIGNFTVDSSWWLGCTEARSGSAQQKVHSCQRGKGDVHSPRNTFEILYKHYFGCQMGTGTLHLPYG
jgi:hypothetical protein